MFHDNAGQLSLRKQNKNSFELQQIIDKTPEKLRMIDYWGSIRFNYERQKLVEAVLPTMERVRYEYEGNSPMPAALSCDRQLRWKCVWRGDMAPLQLVDVNKGLTYIWIYNQNTDPLPIRIYIQGPDIERLGLASGVWGSDTESFLVAYDQVGTFRALINSAGRVVKRVDYDSFGNILHDTLPKFFMPQGFAGGMTDPFTGLTKFGYRYYDPVIGRFTSKDPAKDMRGDGDLYDYCVDDPIGRVDRDGRFFLPLLAGAAGALALGVGVPWVVGKAVDYFDDDDGPSAADAVEDVAMPVASTALFAKAAPLAGAASSYVPATVSRLVPIASKRHKLAEFTSDAAQGYFGPGMPPNSWGGITGAGIGIGKTLLSR